MDIIKYQDRVELRRHALNPKASLQKCVTVECVKYTYTVRARMNNLAINRTCLARIIVRRVIIACDSFTCVRVMKPRCHSPCGTVNISPQVRTVSVRA